VTAFSALNAASCSSLVSGDWSSMTMKNTRAAGGGMIFGLPGGRGDRGDGGSFGASFHGHLLFELGEALGQLEGFDSLGRIPDEHAE
jgi:hypothetical protein